jgi:hypothetical protein
MSKRVVSKSWNLVLVAALASACGGTRRAPAEPRLEYRVACTGASPTLRRPRLPSTSPGVIWEGDSAGWHVLWTESELVAFKTPKDSPPAFFLTEALTAEFSRDENEDAMSEGCVRDVSARVLSVVGPYLSYEEVTTTWCGNGAAAAKGERDGRYVTVDLSASPPHPVDLTAVFPEESVLAALRASPLLRLSFAGPSPPASVRELTTIIATSPPPAPPSACFAVPADLLGRFAFHHVEHSGGFKVALRIGLPGTGACRGEVTRLEATLPAPPQLEAALTEAAGRDDGMLMRDMDAIAGARRMHWRSR